MKLTGFADEAAPDLATQIKATQELGWQYISARGIDGKNIHDLSDSEFDTARGQLEDAGIGIAEFGSLIGSWSKSIKSDFALTLDEVDRAIPRMQQLGTKIVRVMSYAQEPWGEDQHEQERFHRLREISQRFSDAGLITAHENCMNWGGFSSAHTLRLVEEVPALKLIFDTGNPVFQRDRSYDPLALPSVARSDDPLALPSVARSDDPLALPSVARSEGEKSSSDSYPWQDAWQFYQAVREHIIHIHIKDCRNPVDDNQEPEYVFPGEGQAYIPAIIDDLKKSDYQGFIAIEPHVATVFHAKADDVDWNQCYNSYIKYGRALESLISDN
ncbi:MAG: TIM barrel protein [Verrucomicrobiaceae bacterium]|nr:TIM barrel protein [Verrucomicrobiaceae bacterium]